MACGCLVGVKARERRVWTPYRGRCGLGLWARVAFVGAVALAGVVALLECVGRLAVVRHRY